MGKDETLRDWPRAYFLVTLLRVIVLRQRPLGEFHIHVYVTVHLQK